jgi:hypothetical protein
MPDSTDAPQTPGAGVVNVRLMWGEALQWATGQSKVPGGLKRSHDAIRKVFKDSLGTRASFQHLFSVDNPADLTAPQARRAWALLVASGYEPTDPQWGLPAEDVIWPASTAGPARLRALLAEAVQEVQARSHPAGSAMPAMQRMAFAAA